MEGQESGWVPGQIIERLDGDKAIAIDDYTAYELDVEVGEVLIGTKSLNGWLWCQKSADSVCGWVPLDNLQETH